MSIGGIAGQAALGVTSVRGSQTVSSQAEKKLPPQLQQALNKGLMKRLPITFQPFTRQQIRDWSYLFPYEQQSVLSLLLYLANLTDAQLADLFREIVQLEEKMGVRSWQFSTEEQTILNASLLARSPYYQDWRKAVQKVFDSAEEHRDKERRNDAEGKRLILMEIPARLPLDPRKAWQKWEGVGRPLKLQSVSPTAPFSLAETLIRSSQAREGSGLLEIMAERPNVSSAETWIIDAGDNLVEAALKGIPSGVSTPPATLISYQRLAAFRENFSHQINTIQKDLADADAVYARLRQTDVTPWCPPEVASEPVIREFLRSLYLSGNGALIYANSFVEWGASEAFRRARPSVVVAQFGVRSKPKPFTSVAIFENQDQINPLPAVDDLPGSALDAQVMALYIWLAASRYDEYQRNTVCLCIAASLAEVYVVAPKEFSLLLESKPVTIDDLRNTVIEWIAAGQRIAS